MMVQDLSFLLQVLGQRFHIVFFLSSLHGNQRLQLNHLTFARVCFCLRLLHTDKQISVTSINQFLNFSNPRLLSSTWIWTGLITQWHLFVVMSSFIYFFVISDVLD